MSLRRLFTFILLAILVAICLYQAGEIEEVLGYQSPPPAVERVIVDDVIVTAPRATRRETTALRSINDLTEDFEGAWPTADWELQDNSTSDGGQFLWDKSNCHAHGGQYSAWSIGGGGDGRTQCDQLYPVNANTWAIYGPLDLGEASAATLVYYVWGKSEYDKVADNCVDYLFAGSSANGANYKVRTSCGDFTDGKEAGGFYRVEYELKDGIGDATAYIAFGFRSDGSVNYSGFWIDDVTLVIEGDGGLIYLPLVRGQQ
jgi:hypothetical protein